MRGGAFAYLGDHDLDRRRRVRARGAPAGRLASCSRPPPARRRRREPRRERASREAWEEVRRERAASTRARSELHWLRRLAEAGAAELLEASLRRVLEAAAGLGESAAAMLVLPQPDGEPFVATYGLSAEESPASSRACRPAAARRGRSASPTGTPRRRRRATSSASAAGSRLPVLEADGGRLGTLAVFWRRDEREVTEEELERLEGLAGRARPLASQRL